MGAILSSESVDKYNKKKSKSGRGTILIVGLDNSGKTMLTYRLVYKTATQTVPTREYNKETIVRDNRKWDLFDVGGSMLTRESWWLYAGAADGIVFVVDSCDEQRFAEAKLWIRNLYFGQRAGDPVVRCPLLVLANKQDVKGVAVPYRKIEKEIGLEDCPASYKMILPCSASKGMNVEVGMLWLTGAIAQCNEGWDWKTQSFRN